MIKLLVAYIMFLDYTNLPTGFIKFTSQWSYGGEKSMVYTLLQKKRSMESCVSFWEECRKINFVVYFIVPMLLVTKRKKPVSKLFTVLLQYSEV